MHFLGLYQKATEGVGHCAWSTTTNYLNICSSVSNFDSLAPVPIAQRQRRQSNVNIDAVHELTPVDVDRAPGQLYKTESGRLFHSGKIALVTVGLPARGKTYATISMC
jgi:hypothetical protein